MQGENEGLVLVASGRREQCDGLSGDTRKAAILKMAENKLAVIRKKEGGEKKKSVLCLKTSNSQHFGFKSNLLLLLCGINDTVGESARKPAGHGIKLEPQTLAHG